MTADLPDYLPHIDPLLSALRVSRERLNSKSKIAIDAKLLRLLLQTLAARLPFSDDFYLSTYPDVAEAFEGGLIPDLHRHFVESGFFEGRFGAPPPVDEDWYLAENQDVAAAVAAGGIASGAEHYMRSGAAEGRIPASRLRSEVEAWNTLLRGDRA